MTTRWNAWSLAYRDWLLDLATSEANDGFARLSGTKSRIAMYFFDVTKDWSPERRLLLMRGSIKALWRGNTRLGDLELTSSEREAREAFDYPYNRIWRANGGPAVDFTWTLTGLTQRIMAHKLGAAQREDRRQSGGYKLNRKALRRSLRAAMLPRFGKPESFGGIWKYLTRYPGLVVETSVDFATRVGQFRYYHHVVEEDGGRLGNVLLKAPGVSALLGWPQSEWNFLTDEDVPETAAVIARLATEFVDAVPALAVAAGAYLT